MGFVWCRVLVKFLSFSFLMGFVFLFVVYGYRYDVAGQTLKQMNAFVQVQVWDKNQKIMINKTPYTTVENQLNVYHLEAGCYNVSVADLSQRICLADSNAKYISYIRLKEVKNIGTSRSFCGALDARVSQKNCIQDTCFQQPITNAFVYNQVHFVKTASDLWYCAKDFRGCKKLYTTTQEVVCGNDEGLILQNGDLLLLE